MWRCGCVEWIRGAPMTLLPLLLPQQHGVRRPFCLSKQQTGHTQLAIVLILHTSTAAPPLSIVGPGLINSRSASHHLCTCYAPPVAISSGLFSFFFVHDRYSVY